ncbi:MAG: pyridoxal-phosphate dependent enzyme, partial [Acidimicrobiales bacterium]|nr:pyridoxal-phosphate dependent enzyme [Acidimicrobiales bacterium]
GAGTGGTISGVGKFLKEMNKDIQIVVADPENSVFSGGSGRPYLVEGVGEDFWPTTYDQSVVDLTIPISDADSFSMTKRVTEEEGLLIGGSCGTAVAGALKLAKDLSKDDLVVVLLPDSGRGYLSKIFNPVWMAKMGFSNSDNDTPSHKSVLDAVNFRNSETVELLYLNPEETVSSALKTMEKNEISHLPVAVGEMPISAAEVLGSISKEILINNSENKDGLTVKDFLQPPLEIIGVGENIFNVVKLFDKSKTFLVLDKGRPITVLTKSEIEAFVSESENL